MSDKLARPRVEQRERLTFRIQAHQVGIPAQDIRPLRQEWKTRDTVGRVKVDDFWFETTLNDQWAVAYRLMAQREGLAVGEIRVFPIEPRWRDGKTPPGEWSGVLLGTKASVPRGGISSRLLRQVRLDHAIWYCRELLDAVTKRRGRVTRRGRPEHGRSFVAYALARGGVRTGRIRPIATKGRRGRPRLADCEYERLAAAYQQLVLNPSRGGRLDRALAETLGLTVSQVRNRLSRGRKYGFFGRTPFRARPRGESPR